MTTTPPVVTAATGLMTVLWAAELRDLPLPFVTRARGYQPTVELQFHSRAEVAAWAEAMGVDVDTHGEHSVAEGELLEVPLTVCAYVCEES